MSTASPPMRRRLTVFLLLVLALGLGMGWKANQARPQRLSVAAIKDYGGFVHSDWEFVGDKLTPGRDPWGPRWLRRLLGDEYFQEVAQVSLVYDDSTGKRYEVKRTDDRVLAHLEGMTSL